MKVLTMISTIFIPLSFLAGLYGMNFEVIPELKWEYGYFVLLFIMLLMICEIGYFFKKKNGGKNYILLLEFKGEKMRLK